MALLPAPRIREARRIIMWEAKRSLSTHRISVAAIAPIWEVPGKCSAKIALMNEWNHATMLPNGLRAKAASAFGGAVTLRDDEISELEQLSVRAEQSGSRDARLLAPTHSIGSVPDHVQLVYQRSSPSASHSSLPTFHDAAASRRSPAT